MPARIDLATLHIRVACIQAECALWQIRRQWERLLATTTDEGRRMQIAELLREGRCPPDRVIRGYHGRFVGCADGGSGSGHMPEGGIHTRGGIKHEVDLKNLLSRDGSKAWLAKHEGKYGPDHNALRAEVGRLSTKASEAAEKMSADDVAALKTHADNLEKLLSADDPHSLIGQLAAIEQRYAAKGDEGYTQLLADKSYLRLRKEADTRQAELTIIQDHLARHAGEYEPSRDEREGMRQHTANQRYGQGKSSGRTSAGKATKATREPAKAPGTPKASSGRKGSAKSERESLDDLHAKAQAARAKQGLPDEVKPEDVRHTGKDNRPVIAFREGYKGIAGPLPDPFALPDPRRYIAMYGEKQLGLALNELTPQTLRDIARKEGIEQPGSTKAEILSRLVAKVTQGRYSANFGEPTKAAKSPKSSEAKLPAGKRQRAVEKYQLTKAHIELKFNPPPNLVLPDPFSIPDPRRATRMYGPDGAPKAFNGLLLTTLKSMAAKWQERFPEAGAPRSRTSKKDLIDYLTKAVEQHEGKILTQSDADKAWQNDPNLWDLPQQHGK